MERSRSRHSLRTTLSGLQFPTMASGSRQKTFQEFSTRALPQRASASVRAWGCRFVTRSLRNIGAESRLRAEPVEARLQSYYLSDNRTRGLMSEDKTPPVVLLVDDEEMILTSIKAFFAIETDYEFLTYTSPLKALKELETRIKDLDLVISDYLMPEMDGIAFLSKVKERF